jgi:NADH:ubiquinone oxidoreductase subunit 4 (subunit M)
MSHPVKGIVLPIATAMNAVSIFRLFARLFLGKRRTGFTHTADALPRERWILAMGVLFVVLGGLFPNAFVALQSAQVEVVNQGNDSPVRRPFAPIRISDFVITSEDLNHGSEIFE